MPFGEAPAVEDQIVLGHVCERDVERSSRRWRQDHIVERATRDDRFDGAAAAAEQPGEGCSFHLFKILCRGPVRNSAVAPKVVRTFRSAALPWRSVGAPATR